MREKEAQLLLYMDKNNVSYLHTWTPKADVILCRVASFLEDLLFAYYEKMMEVLNEPRGIFDNNVEGVRRDHDRICFVTYFSNEVYELWISYESFLMLMEAWKEVILYRPQEMMLHRIGEKVWLTFERLALEKALIKHSLEGYSFFVGTPGDVTRLAQSLLQVDYAVVQHIISQDTWHQLFNEFIEFTKKNYFRIIVQKKDNQWLLLHSDSTINEYGDEVPE